MRKNKRLGKKETLREQKLGKRPIGLGGQKSLQEQECLAYDFSIVGMQCLMYSFSHDLQIKISYMPQTGICGWIKGGSQGENSKSHVWVDARNSPNNMSASHKNVQKSRLRLVLPHGKE